MNADPIQPRQGVRSILFICTGNTCRSPMAESLCKRQLSRALRCGAAELPARGFIVQSAGLAAAQGQPAAAEAELVVREYEADLSQHRSQPITDALLAQATDIFVMTRSHLLLLLDYYPHQGPLPRLLSPSDIDLDDPIGCDLSVYRECAQAILRDLEVLLPALQNQTM